MKANEINPTRVNTVRTILYWTFGLLPILAGLDKFFHVLTNWDKYILAFQDVIPFAPHTFMMIVGIIEIIAGIIVFIIPRVGAFIVAAWLACIAIVLVAGMNYYDIAVRDIVMALSVFCLGELSLRQKKITRETPVVTP
ncbi:MAG TPA: hypothetical protein VFX43_12835 [Chitinophagaceae bacterium]|jgi:uncharacterized membrane protein YphA (DoxX/SURF4 family)|nr:hypothetical protein [Chitinophagaceae bacterium]